MLRSGVNMSRVTFNALVFPYRSSTDGQLEYAIFKRSEITGGFWQAISGGGEDDETPLETAKRECFEEAGIPGDSMFITLDSISTIPVEWIFGHMRWGDDELLVTEHSFGVHVQNHVITLSDEHTEFRWVSYETALRMLIWDSNRNALWVLNFRLLKIG